MNILEIRNYLDKILWSAHCVERMQARGITRAEVKECIAKGEIIENYPNDFPHPSCLIYSMLSNNKKLHVVVALSDPELTVITVYEPNTKIFHDDLKTRR